MSRGRFLQHASLRTKINLAVLLTFLAVAVASALAFSVLEAKLRELMRFRTDVFLSSLARLRSGELAAALASGKRENLRTILVDFNMVKVKVDGAVFDAAGTLLAFTCDEPPEPLHPAARAGLERGSTLAIVEAEEAPIAVYTEALAMAGNPVGFLRLRVFLPQARIEARRMWLFFAALWVTASALTIGILSLLLRRYVLSPVQTLSRAMEGMEQGRDGAPAALETGDEIGRMAAAFNAMSARLFDANRTLAEQSRDLEGQVARRTAELTAANTRIQEALAVRQAILDNTLVGLAQTRDRIVTEVNRRGASLFGYEPEVVIGKSAGFLYRSPGAFADSADRVDAELRRSGTIAYEAELFRKDGTPIWIRHYGKALDPGDLSRGIVWAFDDITEQKRLQEVLTKAKDEAEAADRAKSDFLAAMSHEIRTPMNAIVGLTEIVLRGDMAEGQRRHLATVKESALHLLSLIDDILDFSKIEAGKLQLETVDFDPRRLLKGVLRTVEVAAGKKGLGLTLTVADEVPAALRGDPSRLRQVVLNLAGNAVKFTEAGSVAVEAELAPAGETPPGMVGLRVRVADTGIGIPADLLPSIFQSFTQAAGSITRKYGGTGLGLSISKELVERMGGRIEVASTVGQGSVFAFTACFAPGDPGRVLMAAAGEAEPQAAGRPLRVLVVEDNALNAMVIGLQLEGLGHAAVFAASAREAMARLAAEPFDVVLMDIEMPEVDGVSAARLIRAGGEPGTPVRDKSVPIVAVTAHAMEDIRLACEQAGMDGFVTKPVNGRQLGAVLARLSPVAAAGEAGVEAVRSQLEEARADMGLTEAQQRRLIPVCLTEAETRLADIASALAEEDSDRAARHAHTLKSTFATVGAVWPRDLAKRLEKELRRGATEAVESLLWQLSREVKRLREVLGGRDKILSQEHEQSDKTQQR